MEVVVAASTVEHLRVLFSSLDQVEDSAVVMVIAPITIETKRLGVLALAVVVADKVHLPVVVKVES